MSAPTISPATAPLPTDPAPARHSNPRWVRPTLVLLLVGTAVLYLWGLGSAGENSYYSAAVQAATQDWKAFFFGSFDASNFITVDKPPASLWLMAISARIFGLSTWSVLVPQALAGVASVGLLFAAVRRTSGPAAGLFAAAALALTPVAALMFRFNNPDALLTLLLVAAAYCTVRAIERAGTRWLVLAGVCIGFGFLTKMGQAFLIVPALALAYLVAAPTGLWRRIWQLLAAGLAIVVCAGWWVAAVELWPVDQRPYIGGSETNSALELALGYNGLGRLFGNDGGGGAGPGGGAGGAGGGGGFGGGTGLTRLFGDEIGTQVSWLLPAALVALVAGLWLTRRAPRTDRTRAALLLWGGWLLVTALVFSYMQGIFHPYYTVALAPGITAVLAIGGRELWRHRAHWAARATLAGLVALTSWWGYVLLDRAPTWHPELRYVLVAVTAAAVAAVLVPAVRWRRWAAVLVAALVLVGLIAPAAYAVETVGTARGGAIPSAGPASTTGAGGTGQPGDGGRRIGFPGGGALPPGGPAGGAQLPAGGLPGAGGGGPGGGGPGAATTADPALVALLQNTATRWAAASIGAQGAAGLQLSSGRPVMAIGGFNGGDPVPSLAQFQEYVRDGQVRYFIAGGGIGGGGGPGRGGTGSEISSWVAANFTATTVGGQTVYDLSQPAT